MKKRLKKVSKRYIAIVLMLLITMVGVLTFYRDVINNASEMAAEDLTEDGELFTMFMDDMLQEKISQLERMAKAINVSVQNDIQETNKILEENRTGFDGLMILSTEGRRQLGEDILFNLVQDDELEVLVQERRSLVHKDVEKDEKLDRYVIMCTPIEHQDNVIAIMVGAIKIDNLSKLVEKWNVSKDGCAFIVSPLGEYITEGQQFEKLLGGEANNFLTYLSNCKIKKNSTSKEQVERSLQKRQAVQIRYSYHGEAYTCNLQPGGDGNWYMGFLKKEKSVNQSAFTLHQDTIILACVSFISWIALVIFLGISIYRNERFRERMERQEILNDLEKTMIFEFHFFPKELCFYGDGESMFGKKLHTLYGEEVYDIYDAIHPDDASVRGRIHQFYDDDTDIFTAEVRIKNSNGYGWYRIIGKLVKDKRYGSNLKFIGKVESADQEIAEEKNLIQKAENDLLTGVLNKKTMEEKVTQCIQSVEGSNHCIFFMVDLDNFKNVNDKLGHISGDKAIVDTAERLQEVFPTNAYIGRLGGDEFAVCTIYDAFDEESLHKYIKKKAENICEVNRRTYSNGEIEVSISSSIGIALAPDQATQWEDLYKKADSALYQSKNGGKNCYHLYQG